MHEICSIGMRASSLPTSTSFLRRGIRFYNVISCFADCIDLTVSTTLQAPPYNRLSKLLIPTSKPLPPSADGTQIAASHDLLLRAGFIRQSSSGMYSFLPLGLRVLEKLERIIDREMQSVGGQKVSLPCLLPSDAWKKTGRWETTGSEMFKVKDRKGSEFCLAPTHEEEITQLVTEVVSSWKQLPLRLYQIGRKYRDEARPRSGLLRAREFLMKDMYSFDASEEAALETYEEVRGAYSRILSDIGIPFASAEADTGNIGGTRSHEYHFISDVGEDTLLQCDTCGYTANEERAVGVPMNLDGQTRQVAFSMTDPLGRAQKRTGVLEIDAARSLNPTKLKQHPLMKRMDIEFLESEVSEPDVRLIDETALKESDGITKVSETHLGDFVTIQKGDACQNCYSEGQPASLNSHRAIEIGHTFFLGTKYSSALNATIKNESNEHVPMQMGCYGIGVSRMMAAIVEASHDKEGIKWPASVAPYQACIVPFRHKKSTPEQIAAIEKATDAIYDKLEGRYGRGQVVVDEREGVTVGFKVKDAMLVGYPLLVVIGKKFLEDGLVEVQERWSGEKRMEKLDTIGI